ncbi:MAG: PAS domain-containing protein [Rhodospirillales bacterium]
MLIPHDDFKVARIVKSDFMDIGDLDVPGLLKAHGYWDRVRAGRVGPPRRDFRLEALPAEVIPCMAVVDFIGPPFDIYYRFFGTRMVEIAGQELTGRRYHADKITGYGFVNAEIFPVMIEKRMPIFSRTQWISVRDLEVTTTTVRLPLSEDGEAVTGGVTANSFRKGHV